MKAFTAIKRCARAAICLLLLSTCRQASAQLQWSSTYGGSHNEFVRSVVPAAGGGYVILGQSLSNDGEANGQHYGTTSEWDLWVVETDSNGAILWRTNLGGSGSEFAGGISIVPGGGYIIAASSFSNDGNVSGHHGPVTGANIEPDVWVVRLSSSGAIIWQKSLGGSGPDWGESVVGLIDGSFLVVGTTQSTDGDVSGGVHYAGSGPVYEDLWAVKLSSSGAVLWQKTYGGTSSDKGVALTPVPDGSVLLVGTSYSNNGDVGGHHGSIDSSDIWLADISTTNGSLMWQKSLGGSSTDEAGAVLIDGAVNHAFYLTGTTRSNDGDVSGHHGTAGNTDLWVAALGPSGSIDWQRSLGGTGDEQAGRVISGDDTGALVICATSASADGDVTSHRPGTNLTDIWMLRLSTAGNPGTQGSFGGSSYEEGIAGYWMNGRLYGFGTTASTDGNVTSNHGGYDYWAFRLAATTGIGDVNKSAPSIYPNPVRDMIYIKPADGAAQNSELNVYNAVGQLQHCTPRLLTKELIGIDVSQLAAGMYYIHTVDSSPAAFLKL